MEGVSRNQFASYLLASLILKHIYLLLLSLLLYYFNISTYSFPPYSSTT